MQKTVIRKEGWGMKHKVDMQGVKRKEADKIFIAK